MLQAWAWGTYIFFAVFLAGGIFWVWWALPETKNTTLEEMDRVFGSHTGKEDARLLREAQRDVGLLAFLGDHDAAASDQSSEHVFQEVKH